MEHFNVKVQLVTKVDLDVGVCNVVHSVYTGKFGNMEVPVLIKKGLVLEVPCVIDATVVLTKAMIGEDTAEIALRVISWAVTEAVADERLVAKVFGRLYTTYIKDGKEHPFIVQATDITPKSKYMRCNICLLVEDKTYERLSCIVRGRGVELIKQIANGTLSVYTMVVKPRKSKTNKYRLTVILSNSEG